MRVSSSVPSPWKPEPELRRELLQSPLMGQNILIKGGEGQQNRDIQHTLEGGASEERGAE